MRPGACHAARLRLDFDLFSACVFCASSLLSADLRPLPGFSGDLTGGYTTFQRRNSVSATGDTSDVTAKFVAAGFGWNRLRPAGLGAGSPASEVRVRVVFPNSHDESREDVSVPNRVIATGDGRYENISVILRLALAPRTSVEYEYLQRRFKGTDIVGGDFLAFAGQRQLVAEEDDFTVGFRQRWEGLELAAHWKHPVLQGSFSTSRRLHLREGAPRRRHAETRGAARRPWGGSVVAEAVGGMSGCRGKALAVDHPRPRPGCGTASCASRTPSAPATFLRQSSMTNRAFRSCRLRRSEPRPAPSIPASSRDSRVRGVALRAGRARQGDARVPPRFFFRSSDRNGDRLSPRSGGQPARDDAERGSRRGVSVFPDGALRRVHDGRRARSFSGVSLSSRQGAGPRLAPG